MENKPEFSLAISTLISKIYKGEITTEVQLKKEFIDDPSAKRYFRAEDELELTALQTAVIKLNPDLVRTLLGTDPTIINLVDSEQNTVLNQLCRMKKLEHSGEDIRKRANQIAKYLIKAKIGINLPNSSNLTPLHYAILKENFSLACLLFRQGAIVRSRFASQSAALAFYDEVKYKPFDRIYKKQYFMLMNGSKDLSSPLSSLPDAIKFIAYFHFKLLSKFINNDIHNQYVCYQELRSKWYSRER